jgi:hypothetical protein
MLFQVSLFTTVMIIRKLDFNFRFKAVGSVGEINNSGIVNFHKFTLTRFFKKLMSCCVAFPCG